VKTVPFEIGAVLQAVEEVGKGKYIGKVVVEFK
jgi:hypothetical protein